NHNRLLADTPHSHNQALLVCDQRAEHLKLFLAQIAEGDCTAGDVLHPQLFGPQT
ncbi:hypothetical protein PBMFNG_PBMFNG_00495, partial [Dysosmobacter welbionis]